MDYRDAVAFTAEEVNSLAAENRIKDILTTLIGRLKALQKKYDFVVCEGLNSQGFLSAFDMDINIEIAKNLGCPFLSVINGHDLEPEETS